MSAASGLMDLAATMGLRSVDVTQSLKREEHPRIAAFHVVLTPSTSATVSVSFTFDTAKRPPQCKAC